MWAVSVGTAGFSICVVEGVGRGVGDRVGVVGKGIGVVGKGLGKGWVEGWGVGFSGGLIRLFLGLRKFLVWPCCLAGLGVGLVVGDESLVEGVGVGTLILGVAVASVSSLLGGLGTLVVGVAIVGVLGEGVLEGGL